MGNRPSAPPPPPPRQPSYVDQQIRQLQQGPSRDDPLPYYSTTYGRHSGHVSMEMTDQEANYDQMMSHVYQRRVPGILQVELDLEGYPLPIDEPIEVTGADGCYAISASGEIQRVQCPCSQCRQDGMINGVCRQLAPRAARAESRTPPDFLEDVSRGYPAREVPVYQGLEYPVFGGGQTSYSPVSMNKVVLPAYAPGGHRRADNSDALYDQAAEHHVFQSRGGYSDDEHDSHYEDDELDSISRYDLPGRNRRFI